ncbi:hypothetical protein BC938DRAFT_475912, partial [Jimgerdemannia flammicorona]
MKYHELQWYITAAQAGSLDAMFHLVENYELEQLPVHSEIAFCWYLKAAEAGHCRAAWRVAVYYRWMKADMKLYNYWMDIFKQCNTKGESILQADEHIDSSILIPTILGIPNNHQRKVIHPFMEHQKIFQGPRKHPRVCPPYLCQERVFKNGKWQTITLDFSKYQYDIDGHRLGFSFEYKVKRRLTNKVSGYIQHDGPRKKHKFMKNIEYDNMNVERDAEIEKVRTQPIAVDDKLVWMYTTFTPTSKDEECAIALLKAANRFCTSDFVHFTEQYPDMQSLQEAFPNQSSSNMTPTPFKRIQKIRIAYGSVMLPNCRWRHWLLAFARWTAAILQPKVYSLRMNYESWRDLAYLIIDASVKVIHTTVAQYSGRISLVRECPLAISTTALVCLTGLPCIWVAAIIRQLGWLPGLNIRRSVHSGVMDSQFILNKMKCKLLLPQ